MSATAIVWMSMDTCETIKGEYEQAGKMPLELKRQDKPFTLNRPQNPKKPYPYVEEDVTFASMRWLIWASISRLMALRASSTAVDSYSFAIDLSAVKTRMGFGLFF